MVDINENQSLYGPKVLEKLKLKFQRSFKQKIIYLLPKMQTIVNVKTLNLRKQNFCPECKSTLFVKINLCNVLRKRNFILSSIIFT